MEKETLVQSVETKETRSGNTRYAVRDAEGNEYSTFRPAIGDEAKKYEGRRARIRFHEEERNGFTNVYLDGIEPAATAESGDGETDAEEAAWRTATDAAPWLLGTSEPDKAIPPEEVFEKLKPFEELVAEDIREKRDDESGSEQS
ncbi:MAG: hypothetical protein ACJ76Z_10515 [Thermoleophilaceae bacterium]